MSAYANRARRAAPISLGALLLFAAAGCVTIGQAPDAVRVSRASATVPSLPDAKRQVDEYISSGRYERDVAAVVAEAKSYVEKRSREGGKLAMVLDIDETALSSLTALKLNDYGFFIHGGCDLQRGPCGLLAWIMMARAEPIKPTLELVRLARTLGVAVFFITGRPESVRAATEKNLREAGFEWTAVILKPDELHAPSSADFRTPERRKIVDQGYAIVVNIGDQWSDLKGGYAERTYKLPNPVYFLP